MEYLDPSVNLSNAFKESAYSGTGNVERVARRAIAPADMVLISEVIDLSWGNVSDDSIDTPSVTEVSLMKCDLVLDMFDPYQVVYARPANDPVDVVTFVEE